MASISLKAKSFVPFFLPETGKTSSAINSLESQAEHRLSLVAFWGITPGSRVLEIGCGQGDCTMILADAVGETGHVDAVDPGAPDYGAPYTLSQAQSHILTTPIGPRINFHTADPVTYLTSLPASTPKYDFVVLAHCIWYFESPSTLAGIIAALAGKTHKLCIAEWSLHASSGVAFPHVLTALLLASLEAKRRVPASGNIRTVLSPPQITAIITGGEGGGEGKFKIEKEAITKSHEGLLDAYWEVSHTLRTREKVLGRLAGEGVGERELGAMRAGYDAVKQSLVGVEGGEKGVRSMDHWVGVFEAM